MQPDPNQIFHQSSEPIVARLKPGDDLRFSLQNMMTEHGIEAGVVISLVGSLERANLRFAGQNKGFELAGPFEIVGASGTLGAGCMHVHIAISDSMGRAMGGHLLEGCLVSTTVEIVILDLSNRFVFERHLDDATGYPELKVRPSP